MEIDSLWIWSAIPKPEIMIPAVNSRGRSAAVEQMKNFIIASSMNSLGHFIATEMPKWYLEKNNSSFVELHYEDIYGIYMYI